MEGLKFRNYSGRIYERMQELLHRRLKHERFDNVAAACQTVFEELVIQWVRNAVAATGVREVAARAGRS